MLRGAARWTALTCVGLLTGTGVVEVGLRLVEMTPAWRVLPVAEGVFYGPDPIVGYTLRPGARGIWLRENRARQRVNAHGMLDREIEGQPPPGRLRVAIFGDSITEALQVNRTERFVHLAEMALQRAGHDVELLNFGLAGATPAVMAARLESTALPLAPDLAVFMISWTALHAGDAGDSTQFTAYVERAGRWQRGRDFLHTRGYRFRSSALGQQFYALAGELRVLAVLNARKNVGLLADLRPPATPPSPQPGVRQCTQAAALQAARRDWENPVHSQRAERIQAFLADVAALTRPAKVSALLLVDGLGTRCDPAAPDAQALLGAMRTAASHFGIALYDLDAALPVARDARRNLRGFGLHRGTGHLNRDGHRAYATAVTGTLAAHLSAQRGTD